MDMGKGNIALHFIEAKTPFEIENHIINKRIRYAIFENSVLNEVMLENERGKFDVIHTHGWLTSSAFMLKHIHKLKWVHTVHALERNRLNSMTSEEKELYKTTSWIEDTIADADTLIAVSENIKSEIKKAIKDIKGNVIVRHNGVDLDFFKPGKKEQETILYIGRLSKEKGIEFIPKIADKILSKNKNAKMIIVAAKSKILALKPVEDKFDELKDKFQERFEWKSDPISATEIAELYKKSTIYIQPSVYEAFGLCILEAMASGNAIIASNVGGIPEVIGEAGILVDLKGDNFIKSIQKLLDDKKLLKKYSGLAIDRAKEFDWGIIAKKTLSLYDQIEKV